MDTLCAELREFLVKSVSKTGGHLSSNLGVVELTTALHKVFDTSKDRLIFDVGHQSYVHKLLTGRKSGFATLRKYGGLAGFPKPSESIHDSFIAGHASTSISVALGMAQAKKLTGDDFAVIAVIGDGALTGGLAFEGLSNAGEFTGQLIIILNDNGMSITPNVGGIARYLSRQRLKPSYAKFKKRYRRLMEILPGGRAIYGFTHNVKTMIKEAILHCSMFEHMGLEYSGPVDGHNINRIVEALQWALWQSGPTVVHILTQKGKGYGYAQQAPEKYHGVRPFDFAAGIADEPEMSFSSVFGEELVRIATNDRKICAITAAMTEGTGLTGFSESFPERFNDVGIAEGHAAAMAAGLASQGAIPVFAVYSSFLQRSYDMLIHDIAISKLHVVLAVDRAGLVPGDGETHQGVFDVAYLRSVPGMTVYSPSNYAELRELLRYAIYDVAGPVALRYPRGPEGAYKSGGVDNAIRLREGDDFTLVTYGISVNSAIEAADILSGEGIQLEIIKLWRICPIDMGEIWDSVMKTGRLLVLEECVEQASVGESIAADLAQGFMARTDRWLCNDNDGESAEMENIGAMNEDRIMGSRAPIPIILLNSGEDFMPCGDVDDLRKLCGIDAESVCRAIREELGIRS